MRDNNPFRLSPTAVPSHYDLRLRPDLPQHRFSGVVTIDVHVAEGADFVELNANQLQVTSARLIVGEDVSELVVELDPEHEILRLRSNGAPLGGECSIKVEFEGELQEDLAGFYRSTYRDSDDNEKLLATTQFESTDARKAFPCFDEPDLKATFKVSIESDPLHTVISNYPIESTTTTSDAKKLTTFVTTMPMSTYLLAFIVGELEVTDVTSDSGVPLAIVATANKAHLTHFGTRVGHHALRFFSDWFQIPYPAPKLDMIAIPDFAAGAMENLGAVTYREALLLIDESAASKAELERVADVICHEIAHMWFGDLVTMKWWNGIWLNEAFATYMELIACDAFNPLWRRWDSFGMSRLSALDVDGLPSTRPIEYQVLAPNDAEDMFDLLTYEKGASILRMLELYLGTDKFRAGVTHYLNTHKYANAETSDLWDAIEQATSAPVRSVMDTWVLQGGHPVISASVSGTNLTLRQDPFRYLSESSDPQGAIGEHWQVPVSLWIDGTLSTTLLTAKEATIPLVSESSQVVVNAGGAGVYRTRYEGVLFDRVLGRYKDLSTLERFNLISDSWALTLNGSQDLSAHVALLRGARSERDPNVLRTMASSLSLLNRIAEPEDIDAIRALTKELFGPLLQEIGLEKRDDDTLDDAMNRSLVIETLGLIASEAEVISAANEQFRMDMSGMEFLAPDSARAILSVIAKHGEDTEFAFILDRYRNPKDPQDRLRNLYALTGFTQPALLNRVAEMTKSEIRIQDAFMVLARLVGNLTWGRAAVEYLFDNWDFFTERFPARSHVAMLSDIPLLCAPESFGVSQRVFEFFAAHPLQNGGRVQAQILERYQLNLRFRGRYGGKLESSLTP